MQHKIVRSVVAGAAMLLISSQTSLFGQIPTPRIQPKPILPEAKIPHRVPEGALHTLRTRIDPAAVGLIARVLRKDTQFRGLVRIEGTVKNIGFAPFRSRPLQQQAQLLQNDRVVARRDFTELAPGASFTLTFDVPWQTSDEFPPCYRLVISYDPDIYIDGNPQNDDANQRNNTKTLKGETIHEIFRSTPTLAVPVRVSRPEILPKSTVPLEVIKRS